METQKKNNPFLKKIYEEMWHSVCWLIYASIWTPIRFLEDRRRERLAKTELCRHDDPSPAPSRSGRCYLAKNHKGRHAYNSMGPPIKVEREMK